MFTVYKDIVISAAHQLRGYKGLCENLHGHNWRIRTYVQASSLDKLGMVIDFKVLKNHTQEVASKIDHIIINEVSPFDITNPTAENIARWFYLELSEKINDNRKKVISVEVWEAENSCAKYEE